MISWWPAYPQNVSQWRYYLKELDRPSWVYAVQCTETLRVKIGVSVDPIRRFYSLQVGSPTDLKLVALVPGDDATEAGIHAEVSNSRIKGEWFEMNDETAGRVLRMELWTALEWEQLEDYAWEEDLKRPPWRVRHVDIADDDTVQDVHDYIWRGDPRP